MMNVSFRLIPRILAISLAGGLVLWGQACSRVQLERPDGETTVLASKGDFCLAEPREKARYTKMLFVIDKSYSNTLTDPGAAKRAESLRQFYNKYKDNAAVQWGLVAFSDPGTEAYIGTAQLPAFVPSSDPSIEAGIQRLSSEQDFGNTPYAGAMALVESGITADLQRNPLEDSTYMVFFLSDGRPTDVTDETVLRNQVSRIASLRPGKVFISTAFYNAPASGLADDTMAILRLQAMAEEGHGKFVNFQTSPSFDFGELLVPEPSKEPWMIKSLLVYNVTSAICANGKYGPDSDGDGLCDDDEISSNGRSRNGRVYNFDPTKRWTEGSGIHANYGDYFRWRDLTYGSTLGNCTLNGPKSDEDFDLLTTCEEWTVRNSNPQGVSNVAGDSRNPDTDLDGFIDGIETFVFRQSVGFALDSFNVLRNLWDFETLSAGQQIQEHRNPMLPDTGAPSYDTRIFPTGINDKGEHCYRFEQSRLQLHPVKAVSEANTLPHLAHAENENVVLFYYLMTPQGDPNGKGVYRYSYQKLKFDPSINDSSPARGLRLDQFSSYAVPE